ncbi:MAG TPA: GNAT family N-acetyltransferase [Terriglobia bacterium]|nr:GNAT family N-acetyltransferase [Terriglobia bacterium]
MTPSDYSVRSCRTIDELAACVSLQQQIWGYSDAEIYPLRLFVNLTHIGGHVLGAFAGDRDLVGFIAAMPAWRRGERYFHSLSLGVAADHENQGLGRRLKLYQREVALAAGIGFIEWTFDPMRAKNAFFNMVRLGATARRYVPDYYGPVGSRLQQGLPSDRLVCEWWLSSPRVSRALEGQPVRHWEGRPAAEVEIPTDFKQLAAADYERAQALQSAVREKLQTYFGRGFEVAGFVRGETSSRYILDEATHSMREHL